MIKFIYALLLVFSISSLFGQFVKQDGYTQIEYDDIRPNDRFGSSMAVDNDFMVVGVPFKDVKGIEDYGAVYLYQKSMGKWYFKEQIIAQDGNDFANFGTSVDMKDGRLIIGAPGSNIGGVKSAGAVYIYEVTEFGAKRELKITADVTKVNARYGHSVSMTHSSGYYLKLGVGAIGEELYGVTEHGNVYVYTYEFDVRPGNNRTHPLPRAIRNEYEIEKYNSSAQVGSVVKFCTGRGWSLAVGIPGYSVSRLPEEGALLIIRPFHNNQSYLTSTLIKASDGIEHARFGSSIAAGSSHLYIGAPGKKVNNNLEQGAVYHFVIGFEVWRERDIIVAPDGSQGDHFGSAIAASVYEVLISAPGGRCSTNENKYGNVYYYKAGPPPHGYIIDQSYVKAPCGFSERNDSFGSALSISESEIIVASKLAKNGRYNEAGMLFTWVRE